MHFSFWRDDEPLFAGGGYAGLSDMAQYAIGGVLRHAAGAAGDHQPHDEQLQATRSRLRSAGEPRLFAAQSLGRLPHSDVQPKPEGQARRIPLPRSDVQSVSRFCRDRDGRHRRHSDSSSRRARPIEKDLYSLPPEELAEIRKTPATLDEALTALERDCDFLLKGDVFTSDVIDTWIAHKARSTKSMPSACGRIRTSFACILMLDGRPDSRLHRLPTFAGGEKCLH